MPGGRKGTGVSRSVISDINKEKEKTAINTWSTIKFPAHFS